MATWKADVFVNSRVGRITTEVEAATFSGAKEQIYAKHGNVQQITNLRQVNNSSGSSSISFDGGGTVALIGLIAAGWAFVSFTPWILMTVGGVAGAWIGDRLTDQGVKEYGDDPGSMKVVVVLALALILGGVGFVKGDELKKGFDAPSSTPTQVQSTNK